MPDVPVKVTRGEPDKTVVVNDGSTIHAGEGKNRAEYAGGQEVTLAGPEADDLVLGGFATYKD